MLANPDRGAGRPHVVVRHRKERLSKCSLTGLETRPDLAFYRYPDALPPAEALVGGACLDLDAPVLGPEDAGRPLIVIDGTWRLAARMYRATGLDRAEAVVRRRLPDDVATAYPRCQTLCPDPARGLASVEALYAAYLATGRDPRGLLDHYHWAEAFLARNAAVFARLLEAGSASAAR